MGNFWKNSMHAACLYAFDKFFWLVIDYVIIVYFFWIELCDAALKYIYFFNP